MTAGENRDGFREREGSAAASAKASAVIDRRYRRVKE
jgi:hypothetical protein